MYCCSCCCPAKRVSLRTVRPSARRRFEPCLWCIFGALARWAVGGWFRYRLWLPQCEVCGRRFADEKRLAKHALTHVAKGARSRGTS